MGQAVSAVEYAAYCTSVVTDYELDPFALGSEKPLMLIPAFYVQ